MTHNEWILAEGFGLISSLAEAQDNYRFSRAILLLCRAKSAINRMIIWHEFIRPLYGHLISPASRADDWENCEGA